MIKFRLSDHKDAFRRGKQVETEDHVMIKAERLEDATLLALKVEELAISQIIHL